MKASVTYTKEQGNQQAHSETGEEEKTKLSHSYNATFGASDAFVIIGDIYIHHRFIGARTYISRMV